MAGLWPGALWSNSQALNRIYSSDSSRRFPSATELFITRKIVLEGVCGNILCLCCCYVYIHSGSISRALTVILWYRGCYGCYDVDVGLRATVDTVAPLILCCLPRLARLRTDPRMQLLVIEAGSSSETSWTRFRLLRTAKFPARASRPGASSRPVCTPIADTDTYKPIHVVYNYSALFVCLEPAMT